MTEAHKDRLEKLWQIGPMMAAGAPHSAKLGIKFVSVDIGRATLCLPYNAALIGNTKTRVLHGGAVTTLLDQACGLAAIAGFPKPTATATLNLSNDYMRGAKPGETIFASAHCHHATQHVAFVRAIAHDGDEDNPIAMAQATFMATSKSSDGPKAGDKS
jgi:uncharacterized protein (TIGR00369 family)